MNPRIIIKNIPYPVTCDYELWHVFSICILHVVLHECISYKCTCIFVFICHVFYVHYEIEKNRYKEGILTQLQTGCTLLGSVLGLAIDSGSYNVDRWLM